ncbi:MAG: hypothetical protein NVS4B11_13660 [Ktedonobacteraceae bacterium]
MRRWAIALLSAIVLGILALIFWELEYQHVSLVLWLLVVVALLWCCTQVAVSLRLYPRNRQRRTRVLNKRPRISNWGVALGSALLLGVIGIFSWLLGFESTSQLLWFLVIVALLWCCVQVSLLLQPRKRQGDAHNFDDERTSSKSWAAPKTFVDRFFPGASLPSGTYNEGNPDVWDGNESLPPH